MKKGPLRGFVFYTRDYFGDVSVRLMPAHLRILWVEAFFLMDQSPRRGVLLQKNGHPYSVAELASIMNAPAEDVEKMIHWVIHNEIADVDRRTKAIACRKMIREEKQKAIDSSNGHQGGNPALTKNYDAPGFIYLIRRKSDHAVKIGIAINVQRRLYKLRQKYPRENLTLLGFTPSENMGAMEAKLHERFNGSRVEGEWFKLTPEQIDTLNFTLTAPLKGKLPLKGTEPDPEPDPEPKGKGEANTVSSSSPPTTSASADSGPKYSPEFEHFWQRSTRRGSKVEAGKEWQKLKPNEWLQEKISNGMRNWMSSEQWQDETKQPHICRWLKRRGWEEIVPRAAARGHVHSERCRDFGFCPEATTI